MKSTIRGVDFSLVAMNPHPLSDDDRIAKAYEDALVQLSTKTGVPVAALVWAVIASKTTLTRFEVSLSAVPMPDDVRDELIHYMVESVSDSIATMCTLLNKQFNADIAPLVTELTNKVVSENKHLLQ